MVTLSADEVRAALPMSAAIEAMHWAYIACSTGQTVMPPRIHLEPPGGNLVSLVMPAYVAGSPDGRFPPCLAVKTVSVCPGNAERGLATVLGAVLVLDPMTGAPLALLDGAALTALRTGAGSGAATDLLARPDAATLALFGAGAQAESQLEAVCCVRRIRTVWIYTRTAERAESLRVRWAGIAGVPDDIRIAGSAQEALADADIVCTATTARAPLFRATDIRPGTHINAVGAFRPTMQEIPPETVAQARVFVDNREAALHEAGDLVVPIAASLMVAEDIAGEIGSALAGTLSGRQSPAQITLFKSVGMAAQDAVAAALVIQRILPGTTSTRIAGVFAGLAPSSTCTNVGIGAPIS